jgi:uridine monophosphate synthetase
MDSFFHLLDERAHRTGSLLCIGLDPIPADLPEPSAEAARAYCRRMIESTRDLALAYKINATCFLAFGAEGWNVLREAIALIPRDIPTIIDGKVGEIPANSATHVHVDFKLLGASAVTLNPYLGYDSIQPFIKDAQRGAFLLCKTTNTGSVDLQELPLAGEGLPLHLYEKVALLAQEWNTNDNLGLVVSAMHPEDMARIRQLAPAVWIMATGIGSSNGELANALRSGLRSDGLGLLVPVSRAIWRANDPHQAALMLHEAVTRHRQSLPTEGPITTSPELVFPATLADDLLSTGCVRFGQFTLKSGETTPIYIDLRQLISHPHLLAEVSAAYLPILRRLAFDRIAALPYAALPIATTLSLQSGWPVVFPRKEARSYGNRTEIEGKFNTGETVVVINDIAGSGMSKFEAISKLVNSGMVVQDVVVLIDRQLGAAEALAEQGLKLHSVLTLTSLLDYWQATGRVASEQIAAVRGMVEAK